MKWNERERNGTEWNVMCDGMERNGTEWNVMCDGMEWNGMQWNETQWNVM